MDKRPRLLPVFNTQISSTAGNPLLASIAVQAGTATVTDSTGNLWARDRVGFLSGSNTRVEMCHATDAARTTGNPLDLVGGAINTLWAPLRAREILRLNGTR
jgi:hypothetical protein